MGRLAQVARQALPGFATRPGTDYPLLPFGGSDDDNHTQHLFAAD